MLLFLLRILIVMVDTLVGTSDSSVAPSSRIRRFRRWLVFLCSCKRNSELAGSLTNDEMGVSKIRDS